MRNLENSVHYDLLDALSAYVCECDAGTTFGKDVVNFKERTKDIDFSKIVDLDVDDLKAEQEKLLSSICGMQNKLYVKSFSIDKIKTLLKDVDSEPDIYSKIKDNVTDYYIGAKKIVDVTVEVRANLPLLVFHFSNGDHIGFCCKDEELVIRLNESMVYSTKNGLFSIEGLKAEQEKLLSILFEE